MLSPEAWLLAHGAVNGISVLELQYQAVSGFSPVTWLLLRPPPTPALTFLHAGSEHTFLFLFTFSWRKIDSGTPKR